MYILVYAYHLWGGGGGGGYGGGLNIYIYLLVHIHTHTHICISIYIDTSETVAAAAATSVPMHGGQASSARKGAAEIQREGPGEEAPGGGSWNTAGGSGSRAPERYETAT